MASFSEAFTRLRQDLDESQEKRSRLIQDTRRAVQARAQQTMDELAEQASNRHTQFAAMMGDLRNTVREQAHQTRERLASLGEDLRRGGAAFKRG